MERGGERHIDAAWFFFHTHTVSHYFADVNTFVLTFFGSLYNAGRVTIDMYGPQPPMILLDAAHAQDFIAHLELFEGRTGFPYCDTVGIVTIGVGCAIFSASQYQALNWLPGTDLDLVAAEWQVVRNSTPGLVAAAYTHLTTLRLPDAEIDRLRDARIASTESDLIYAIQGVSEMPQAVRQCLADIAFNIGAGKLHSEYFGTGCRLGPAIYARDWQTAAQESARHGIQPARNQYVRDLIMSVDSGVVS